MRKGLPRAHSLCQSRDQSPGVGTPQPVLLTHASALHLCSPAPTGIAEMPRAGDGGLPQLSPRLAPPHTQVLPTISCEKSENC